MSKKKIAAAIATTAVVGIGAITGVMHGAGYAEHELNHSDGTNLSGTVCVPSGLMKYACTSAVKQTSPQQDSLDSALGVSRDNGGKQYANYDLYLGIDGRWVARPA